VDPALLDLVDRASVEEVQPRPAAVQRGHDVGGLEDRQMHIERDDYVARNFRPRP
jgi:hypothetical protein